MFLSFAVSLPPAPRFEIFSHLIHSLCFELRCPAGIVNQLPTQTFNLLPHSWLCLNLSFSTKSFSSASVVTDVLSVSQLLNTVYCEASNFKAIINILH